METPLSLVYSGLKGLLLCVPRMARESLPLETSLQSRSLPSTCFGNCLSVIETTKQGPRALQPAQSQMLLEPPSHHSWDLGGRMKSCSLSGALTEVTENKVKMHGNLSKYGFFHTSYFLFILFYDVRVGPWTEVRQQLCPVSSLLPPFPWVLGIELRSSDLCNQQIYLLSCLTCCMCKINLAYIARSYVLYERG